MVSPGAADFRFRPILLKTQVAKIRPGFVFGSARDSAFLNLQTTAERAEFNYRERQVDGRTSAPTSSTE